MNGQSSRRLTHFVYTSNGPVEKQDNNRSYNKNNGGFPTGILILLFVILVIFILAIDFKYILEFISTLRNFYEIL